MNISKKQGRKLDIKDCGQGAYGDSLKLQLELVKKRQTEDIGNAILFVEHGPVITLGANKRENKLLFSDFFLKDKGIDVESVGRGGGATAHNPGQIVMYPIVNLKSLGLGVNEYVREIEAIGIELLEKLGIKSERKKGAPGLWVGGRKIGSVGVKIKRWVTYHGLAINIYNDLEIFKMIVPCGIEGVDITSVLKETGKKWDMGEIKRMLGEICMKHWGNKG